MRGFFRSVLGLFNSKPTGADSGPELHGDGANKWPEGVQAKVGFRVPGMS